MTAKVHLAPVDENGALPDGALCRLFEAAGLGECFREGDMVALKLHFGTPGNRNVWQPGQVREIADEVRSRGGRPFLTDANVLYRGPRHDAIGHLEVAHSNGFSFESTGCPLVIADGLRGDDSVPMPVPGGKHYETAKIAGGIARADAILALTHVTGHIVFGFAGAIKNLGMGSGSAAGKQMMHERFLPEVDSRACIACGTCAEHCPTDAITVPEGSKAVVDEEKCIGCGECVAHCPTGAIPIQWGDSEGLQERTVEFCAAILARRPGRCGFLSLLTAVTGQCDCVGDPGGAIVPDIGAVAGRDIVAVDEASLDLVKGMRGGQKRLGEAAPNTRPGLAGEVAERMGLGSRQYELLEV